MRINVGGIKQVDTGLDAEIDLPARSIKIDSSYSAEFSAATKSHRPEAEHRDP